MNTVKFSVPGVPPSYNQSFKIAFKLKQVYLSPDAKRFKDKVMIHIPYFEIPDEAKITIIIKYHDNWYYKNGKLKRKDVQNMDKLIIDAIFKRLGVDDSHVWCNVNVKVQNMEEIKTEITITY